MANVVELIKQDHQHIREMYQKASQTTDVHQKQIFANEFIRALAVHSVAEEIAVYPAVGSREGEQTSSHSREEHLAIKEQLYRLDQMRSTQRGFDEQLNRVMGIVEHHVQEEETAILPELTKTMREGELVQIGQQFEKLKSQVPTHPHTLAPDRGGMMETAVGIVQAPIDKLYDFFAREFPVA